MLEEDLKARRLPALLTMRDGTPVSAAVWPQRRRELLELLAAGCYGRTPPALPASAETVSEDPLSCAGKVLRRGLRVTLQTPGEPFSFPVQLFLPKNAAKPPLFLQINFRPDCPDRYTPVEEITDGGFALACFDYRSVSSDDGDFASGLAGRYIGKRERRPGEWGKIGMWAYACSRVLDVLLADGCVDSSRAFVTGHSRLGKTALWCAAQDTRFAMGVSNDSGCGGAALERGKRGERTADITRRFPYWFCPAYRGWAGRAEEMPFDQHFLLACLAPRAVYVASAEEDAWADPASEFLACAAASPAYRLLGKEGLVCGGAAEPPAAPAVFHGGRIAYHLRGGTHYYSRRDWRLQMDYARTL